MQLNLDNIHKNIKRVYHDYKVRYKGMITYNDASKYETPYNQPFEVNKCQTNRMVTFQCGAIISRYNIHSIKRYTSHTNVENVNAENNICQCQHLK